MQLSSPIEQLDRVGPAYAKRFRALGIATLRDLLFHFPSRYEDLSSFTKIKNVKAGQGACLKGTITDIQTVRSPRKKTFVTNAILSDETGSLKITWFGQLYLSGTLKKGDEVCMAGPVKQNAQMVLQNPSVEKVYQDRALVHMGRIVPVYPETKGLSSRFLRSLLFPLLKNLPSELEQDPLPLSVCRDHGLFSFKEALQQIHFPSSSENAEKAKKRMMFEEVFFISLWTVKERRRLSRIKAIPVPSDIDLVKDLVASLPFALTDAQRKAAWQVIKDMEKPRPMNRLLEGDVGSGKTVVASIAALVVAKAKYQAALLAPTEILAKQHFKTVFETLKGFNVNIGLLTGKEDKFYSKKLKTDFIEVSRTKLLKKIEREEIDILVGTHAIIQKNVRFSRLALLIVDEQHRFGVKQRSALLKNEEEARIPHLLSMTATPIPRTLALTIYGDLDVSVLDQMPKGRKKVSTEVIPPRERTRAYEFVREQIKNGRQAFVVCPRIEKPEEDKKGWTETRSAKEEYEKLSKEVFPDLRVGLLHGKMPAKEKERTSKEFARGRIDILVATSVIEVGVDFPNASVMIVEGAERFGLAQLHQLRGRVGRGEWQSYCFLFTDSSSPSTISRMNALLRYDTGFELAQEDLRLRGPGEFTGTRQWGIPDLLMEALQDRLLVEKARESAARLVEEDPSLRTYPLAKEKLARLSKTFHSE